MRTLLEIILAAALIALAWEKSLEERARDIPWLGEKMSAVVKSPDHPRSSTLNSRPVSTPAAWMWDPNRRSVLDTPPPKSTTVHSAPTSTAGSWMFDPESSILAGPATQAIFSPLKLKALTVFSVYSDARSEAPVGIRDDQNSCAATCLKISFRARLSHCSVRQFLC